MESHPLGLRALVLVDHLLRTIGRIIALLFPEDFADSHCERDWDGLLCWQPTLAGTRIEQQCPDMLYAFDTSREYHSHGYRTIHVQRKGSPIESDHRHYGAM